MDVAMTPQFNDATIGGNMGIDTKEIRNAYTDRFTNQTDVSLIFQFCDELDRLRVELTVAEINAKDRLDDHLARLRCTVENQAAKLAGNYEEIERLRAEIDKLRGQVEAGNILAKKAQELIGSYDFTRCKELEEEVARLRECIPHSGDLWQRDLCPCAKCEKERNEPKRNEPKRCSHCGLPAAPAANLYSVLWRHEADTGYIGKGEYTDLCRDCIDAALSSLRRKS